MSREERLRRQDSWNQIKVRTRVQSDGVSRLLTEIFSQSSEDLAQLMSDSRLTHAIGTLTGLQRQVLFLEFVERYTTGEIAAMLGSSPRNIRAPAADSTDQTPEGAGGRPDSRYKRRRNKMNLNDQYAGACAFLGAVQPVRVPAVPRTGCG